MANYGLFIGWNRPIPGREADAHELFSSTMSYFSKQQKAGVIHSFDPVIMYTHGGSMNGFFLLRGTQEQMDKLRRMDDFIDLIVRLNYTLQDVGVVHCWVGEGVNEIMPRYQKVIRK